MNKILVVMVLLGLMVLGLNASSQGISSLTAEKSNPVLGFQIEKQQLNVFALGEKYSLSRGEVSVAWQEALEMTTQQYRAGIDYLKKIWSIFNVVFLK